MKNANVFLGSLDMFRFKDVPKIYENMFRRGHFVLQRAESALKAIQRKLLDARSIVRGCMLMSPSLKWSKTFSTGES